MASRFCSVWKRIKSLKADVKPGLAPWKNTSLY